MPDQRSVMKEFRFLDAKRLAQGLTPAEEARLAQLRDLVGPEMGAGGLRSGFDVDAAAARLRESLLPAGLRNRPPSAPAPAPAPAPAQAQAQAQAPAPEPEPEPPPAPSEDLAADALAAAYEAEPLDPSLAPPPEAPPEPDTFFDPATLGFEQDPSAAAPDPGAQAAWDPGQTYDPSQPDDAGAAYDPSAAPLGDVAAQPYDPNAAGYDPAALPYDPSQGFDPNAQPAWEPNAPYDPNAAAYDPNAAAYDPNAAAYDPSAAPADPILAPPDPGAQPYDPNAAGYDPAALPYDPSPGDDPNAQAAWDPNAPYDPNAAAYDPNAAPTDPFLAQLDPGAEPYDPNAAGFDTAQGGDPGPPPAWDPDPGQDAAAPGDPSAADDGAFSGAQGEPLEGDVLGDARPAAEPYPAEASGLPPAGWNVEPPAPGAVAAPDLGEYEETLIGAPFADDAGLESMLPFDPAAEAAIAPGDLPEGFGGATGEYDDTAGFSGAARAATPGDLAIDGSGFQAAQGIAPDASEGWRPEAALDEGFRLESGGSFDATAEAAAPEWAGGAAAPPWESAPEGADPGAEPGEPLFDAADVDPSPAAAASGEPLFDASAYATEPSPAPSDGATDVYAEATEADLEEVPLDELESVPAPSPADPAQALDFAEPDLSVGPASAEAMPFAADPYAAEPAAEAATLEFAEEPAPLETTPGEAPPFELAAVDAPGEPTPGFPGFGELSAAPVEATAPAVPEDEIPTIDGEDILEEIPPEENAPPALEFEPLPAPVAVAPVAEPPPSPVQEPADGEPTCHVAGAHRVVVHTVEGQVKRGTLEDADLDAPSLGLSPQPGAAAELVATEKVKAIFFMLSPGEKAPAPEGKKVRVTFRDGRQVAGFSPDYTEDGVGFFMIPGDTRTNTGRIWVYRAAVRQVTVS